MNETEKLKFRLSADKDQLERRVPCNFNIITLKDVDRMIDEKEIDEETKEKLKKMAKNYPFQALSVFIKNIDKHIVKIRNQT